MQASMMLPVGVLLHSGKYRVMRYLSSGGFGNTYVVEKTKNGEILAMKEFFMRGLNERGKDTKTISVSNSVNEQTFTHQKEKFKKEANRLAQFNHRNLVKVHGLFEENGTAYYLMDYIDGDSLSSIMEQKGRAFTEPEVCEVLFQVLDALEEIHKKKMWHLDLKPGNILLDNSNRAVLIDFGASKQMMNEPSDGNIYTTTSISFTPGYAPPEQADQNLDMIGPWTDFYALGATLFNVLTRRRPPTVSLIQEKGIDELAPDVSPVMRNFISWLMNPQRAKRPQSVAEIRSYLQSVNLVPQEDTVLIANEKDTVLRETKPDNETHSVKNDDKKPAPRSRTGRIAIACAVSAMVLAVLFVIAHYYDKSKAQAELYQYEEEQVVEPTVETVTADLMPFVEAKDGFGFRSYLDDLKETAEEHLRGGNNDEYFNIINIIKTVWENNKDKIIAYLPFMAEEIEPYITVPEELREAFDAFTERTANDRAEAVKEAAEATVGSAAVKAEETKEAIKESAASESSDAWNDDFFNEGYVYEKKK